MRSLQSTLAHLTIVSLTTFLAASCKSAPKVGIDQRPSNPTCVAPERPTFASSVGFDIVFPALSFSQVTGMEQPHDDGSRWWLAEQRGLVHTFEARDDVEESSIALDIRDRVRNSGEQGLLGLALHPDFANNGQLYVRYSAGGLQSRLSRFTSSDGGLTFNASTEQIVLTLKQPYGNHNGGDLQFGPDGMLYVAFGDGGAGGDPHGNGQNPFTWLGAVLRIDVSGAEGYTIPPDNPFADSIDGAPEVWAWGLRNPWRVRFDRQTGELWAGDVGQNKYEEVHRLVPGGNHGWNIKEGTHCYGQDPCDLPGLIDPIVAYDHSQGRSITGGEVYRGSTVPDLRGVYLYADFYPPAPVWGLFVDPQTGEATSRKLGQVGQPVGTFAQGADGEVYIPVYSGQIRKIVASTPSEGAPFPQHLSETGCTDGADATRPSSGLIPYGVNQPLWSDNADKKRWIGLPDGEVATVGVEGHLELPVGSVLVKEFALDGVRLETRLLVRHDDGAWAGYAYKWLPDGSDAVWVPAGGTATHHGGTWDIPSQAQCSWCHTDAAGGSLGPELGQLDGTFTYPGDVTADQLATWQHIGLLEVPETVDTLPTPGGDDSVERRARAYLHSNCAHCHRPDGGSGSELDLRWSRDLAQMKVCDVEPEKGDVGVNGAKLLVPGDPAMSIISLRMHTTDEDRMPQVGTVLVDDAAVAIVDAWIEGIADCP